MPKKSNPSFAFFYRRGNLLAEGWEKKIRAYLKRSFPKLKESTRKPDVLLVLGGDGAILEAARIYQRKNPIILGLNLGHVGFLASAGNPQNFLSTLKHFFNGRYSIEKRMLLQAEVKRENKKIFSTHALNEVVVHNPLGIVEIQASIDGHPMQQIRGSGALVATATGSTGYNLSAHGPIVMPQMPCMIMTELLDHSIPTPSIVLEHSSTITLMVTSFRTRNVLRLGSTNAAAEVLLVADGDVIFPLHKKDEIIIKQFPTLIKFASLEPHHFLKSLQEKFSFK